MWGSVAKSKQARAISRTHRAPTKVVGVVVAAYLSPVGTPSPHLL